MQKLKFWGWGYEGEGLDASYVRQVETLASALFGVNEFECRQPPELADIQLRKPRCTVPQALQTICSVSDYDRALHSYGQSFYDSVRKLRGEFRNPPDVVAFPTSEADVLALYEWAERDAMVLIPFGGGTSVVGGVEPPCDVRPVVTINLRHLNQVLEIDEQSQAVRVQGGTYGPLLEQQLKPHGYTLRFFPQSFEFSTVGGWIATRAGGHFAMQETHIDDLVEGLRMVSPRGVMESRRLPGSGAGPSPDRLMIGSEGILGIITEAWLKIRKRPDHKWSASISFSHFEDALQAVRTISQSGLTPSNCRLLDPQEALLNAVAGGNKAVLVLAFESNHYSCEERFQQGLAIAREHGGLVKIDQRTEQESSEQWKKSFIKMPYLREYLTARGIINETFETAMTWERLPAFIDSVRQATMDAIRSVTGRSGFVSCRLTHIYRDGAAPYFTFLAYGDPDRMLEQCAAIKQAAADQLIALGGTITHHHAVGRDHRPWYDQQRPDLFADTLRAAKVQLDPEGLLNPGVLIDP